MADLDDRPSRRFLAPDLEGQIVAATEPLEELLLMIAGWADDDPTDIPALLHRQAAAEAVGELRVAFLHANYRLVYGPDGHYEHAPVADMRVPSALVTTCGDAVRLLAGRRGVTEEALEQFCLDYPHPLTPEELVETAARFHGLIDLEWGTDQELLADRLQRTPEGQRVVLSEAEEGAYRRMRDRWVAMWHDFSALERWLY